MLQTVKAEKVNEKNGVICLVSMFPFWVMVLKLSKKLQFFLQFFTNLTRNLSLLKQFTHSISKVSSRTFRKWYWVNIFIDILIGNISWTVAQTSINQIIFWKRLMRTFRFIYVNYFNRLRFLAEISTKLQKMHCFGQFKDHNSESKHGNYTNDPTFYICFVCSYW